MIAAIVLAAGLSKRMGRPKLTLSWGQTTVIGHVVDVLIQAGVGDIVVVTGGARQQVDDALKGLPARTIFNPRYAKEELAYSLQAGLSGLSNDAEAALVVLGDQPQMEVRVVMAILHTYQQNRLPLVVPSYHNRRGHPWLIGRSLWKDIMDIQPPQTLRSVLAAHAAQIEYLPVDTDTVLRDLDTPEDYAREKANSSF